MSQNFCFNELNQKRLGTNPSKNFRGGRGQTQFLEINQEWQSFFEHEFPISFVT